MKFAVVLSLMLGAIGVVLWTEGGPTPRTPAAWLPVAILIVAALPELLCWMFC